jgi:peptide/nickel transport system substrate-binding protein
VTAQDYVFTARLDQDTDMPWIVNRVYRFIDSVDAPDARTVKVNWKQAYIRADQTAFTPLYPRHILEEPYLRGEKQNISTLPFWTTEFVGTGPFRVRDWVVDSHVTLVAFDRWALGRPRIDELEIKFIPDDNALTANLLAGAIEFTLGPGLSVDQGIQIRDRWPEGTMLVGPSGDIKMNTQLLNPDPPILLNVQFRKALYIAIDRQTLVNELVFGLTHMLDSSIGPFHMEYKSVEPSIVKYPYDPRGATRMIEELGYRKGPDGMFRDTAGQPLSIQIMATTDDTNAKPQQVILDMWKQIGITPELEAVTQQRQRDLAFRANFKAFSLQSGQSFGPDNLDALLTENMRTPDKNYVGKNYTRHSNPEIDALVVRYYTTIPFNERMQILGQLVRYTTDQLIWMMLYERVVPTMVNNRLVAVPSLVGDQWWNAHLWDVKS